jgi:uncharacterized protein YndB with AHSA1/START domain
MLDVEVIEDPAAAVVALAPVRARLLAELAEIRFRSAAERAAFTDDLVAAVTALVSRYHDLSAPKGRPHRLVVAAHPIPPTPDHRGGPMIQFKQDAPATRSIALEVEVPGTPEQVWQAIATGPGITAWFVPTEVAEREGGAVTFQLGPGMDSTGVVTAWEPPRRFAFEERDWMPGAPPVATELFVEARAGGTCVVRLVSSLFTESADWDDQLEGFETGWRPFLEILRLVLTHFAGQRCSPIRALGSAAKPLDRAWAALAGALGLAGGTLGERAAATADGVPALSGVVARVGSDERHRDLLLRTEEPGPGLAVAGVYTDGDRVHAMLSLYLFGDQAPAIAARDEPAWTAWMERHFPSAGPAPETGATAG